MVWHPEELTAMREAVRGDSSRRLNVPQDRITTSFPVTPSTQSTTQSSMQDLIDAKVRQYMSPISPASSVPTSSNTSRSEESLSNPDPNSWIQSALDDLSHNLASKNEDYRIDGEFSNFEHTAALVDTTPEDVILTQIGIKLGRLNGLRRSGGRPNNEALIDTYHDLAGYAVILYAYIMSTREDVLDTQPYSEGDAW